MRGCSLGLQGHQQSCADGQPRWDGWGYGLRWQGAPAGSPLRLWICLQFMGASHSFGAFSPILHPLGRAGFLGLYVGPAEAKVTAKGGISYDWAVAR